ncbi:YhcH/YjgK/YiaL family protein [Paenibacillus sp. P22]|uniref:YhcH/YjgK/YiaL family protein n=1 Tax=Paenibacillus sp. P22 TaxID=483908 RepID=UPI00038F9FFE|nr:YhcH/YjgK/YiaL family protein [Paenibacillus sp. P22]CDN41155.1 Protein YiaL [Paenibacillus sp. P22]
MIADALDGSGHDSRYLHPVLQRALAFLLETDFSKVEDGRIDIDGDRFYAQVMSLHTVPPEERLAEKHERCIDIHFLLEGEEDIGWKPHDGKEILHLAYDAEQDCTLYRELERERRIRLEPGMYMMLFPSDIHRPGLGGGERARKAVVKIASDLLQA